ncbi:hypothetical protein D9757_012953 [Collybiopsis confluens]|uniref:Uncharacterized protein n=1 Tax=Collybiopsis confluens TaxID=2823264 RepID=A0A8H5G5H8_9AGAR|nr:hypothetical protein D9757_012953 [Collybiopsis confluens]
MDGCETRRLGWMQLTVAETISPLNNRMSMSTIATQCRGFYVVFGFCKNFGISHHRIFILLSQNHSYLLIRHVRALTVHLRPYAIHWDLIIFLKLIVGVDNVSPSS